MQNFILNFLEPFISFIFPLREESLYFKNWQIGDYRKKLIPNLSVNNFYAVFSYKDTKVKKLIKSLKKEKAYFIGEALSEILAEEILASFNDDVIDSTENIYIVPIPISKNRLKQRGFNQTAWIAKKTAEKLGNNFIYKPNYLTKTRETKKQSVLHRKERLTNPKNSFKAGKIAKGAKIILFDDVITTGATVNEAKRVLKKAGAREIKVYCIAH